MKFVTKRDGRIAKYDSSNIIRALKSAYIDNLKSLDIASTNLVDNVDDFESVKVPHDFLEFACNLAARIENRKEETMSVEQIQDIIVKALMGSRYKDVAKRYIIFRDSRTKAREYNSKLVRSIISRNNATNVVNSNANVDEKSFSGREKEASGDVQKYIAFELAGVSDEMAKAHKEMRVYQHDAEKSLLGVHNCLFIDFEYIFKNGFITRNGGVRPPKSLSTACQLYAVVFQCQSQVC